MDVNKIKRRDVNRRYYLKRKNLTSAEQQQNPEDSEEVDECSVSYEYLRTINEENVLVLQRESKDVSEEKLNEESVLQLQRESKDVSEEKLNESYQYLEKCNEERSTRCEEKEEERLKEIEHEKILSEEIAEWALECSVNEATLSKLLKILYKRHKELGTENARTFLGRFAGTNNRHHGMISDCSGGEIWYKGVKTALGEEVKKNNLELKPGSISVSIDIGIDGLPLYKNSPVRFCPILGALPDQPPFIIGVYCGINDPEVEPFLNDYVSEMESFNEEPLRLEESTISLSINNYVLDAIERQHIKCVVPHSSYYGCERCEAKGMSYRKRMCFLEMNAPLRTDSSFNDQKNQQHHKGVSPLIKLGTKMISQVPIEYMHMNIQVMKRLLHFLLTYLNPSKLSSRKKELLDKKLKLVSKFCPCDFNRKPREAKYYKRFKATELRAILLYTGMVVFQGILEKKNYIHFLKLSLAFRILLSEKYFLIKNQEADRLLREFVIDCVPLYGKEMVVYYVHNLIHVSSEVKAQQKTLEKFSAFKFENELKTIKHLLKSPYKPLQQIIKLDRQRVEAAIRSKQREESREKTFFEPHNSGPTLGLQGRQYKRMKFKNSIINTKVAKDSCVKTKYGICLVQNIVEISTEVFLIVKYFEKVSDWFLRPARSGEFDIFIVGNLLADLEKLNLKHAEAKCFLMPTDNKKFITIPLVHTA